VPTPTEIRSACEALSASPWLRESFQLRALLRYVVEETLDGRSAGLKEYNLGREVFHRPSDYDPRHDAIVRVQASLLRKRIASYYEHEGLADPVRIELPRGAYLPAFHRNSQVATPAPTPPVAPPPTTAPPVSPPSHDGSSWRRFSAGLLAGLLLATASAAALLLINGGQKQPPTPAPLLWGPFLDPAVETVVSFGIPLFYVGPDGLYVRDTHVNTPGEEERGKIRWLAGTLNAPLRPQEDVYTGVGDVLGTHLISRWLDQRQVHTSLANSHHLGHSDVNGKNLIVVSSARFQTLLQEMRLPSRIHFDPDVSSGCYLLDDPQPGERRAYVPTSGTGVDTSYAVLTLWPGKQASHRILYLSGVTTWATQGAAEFVIHPDRLTDLQQRLSQDPTEGPKGTKSPYFQVLLRVEGKNNLVRSAHYLTHRYLPAPVPPQL
jgi:hypothetical protein